MPLSRTKLPSLLVAAPVLLIQALGCTPAPFKPGSTANGSLEKHGQVWLLELSGTEEERGRAAGVLLGEQIRWLLPRYLKTVLGADGSLGGERLELVKTLEKTTAEEHLRQLRAMAAAARVSYHDLLAINYLPEIFSPMLCSCFALRGDRSHDGTLRVGRNLDWFGGQDLRHHALIVVERLPSGRRFASLTWPGLVGVVTGMNGRGLTIADLVVLKQREEAASGVPVLFTLRSMLEQASTPAEARAWLEAVRRTVPQSYIIADADDALVLETTPGRVRVRDMSQDFVAVGNLFDEDKGSHPRGRYSMMVSEISAGKMSVDEMQGLLEQVALGELNVQSAVLEPATRRVHIATERRPAASGTFHLIDLSPWLGTESAAREREERD